MTLIITAAAAIVVTLIRFRSAALGSRHHLGFLALMYWGASLMWCVDWGVELSSGVPFGELVTADAGSEALLGLCVVALGVLAWAVFRAVRIRSKS